MTKFYREVKASERLPEEDGEYFVYLKARRGYVRNEREISRFSEGEFHEQSIERRLRVDVWLEPVVVTEDELKALEEYRNMKALAEKEARAAIRALGLEIKQKKAEGGE